LSLQKQNRDFNVDGLNLLHITSHFSTLGSLGAMTNLPDQKVPIIKENQKLFTNIAFK
jgi:hypothetical protein